MFQRALVGVAWEDTVQDSPDRKYYRVNLDLGVLPSVPCRIVENPNQEKEKSPSHLMFYSPLDGDGVKVGAFWPFENGDGDKYLTGRIDLSAFGILTLKGGARVDFRLTGEEIRVRFTPVRDRKDDRTPTHQLWRMRPVSKNTKAEEEVAEPENE